MICTYLEPVNVHPDRLGGTRPMPPKLIVLHTSEQSVEGPNAARDLARFITSPGDRSTSSGGRYGSSYHDIVDVGRVIRPAVPHHRVAYSAPGANTQGLHVCLPGRAGQDLAGWSDGYSSALLDTLASYIVDQATRYDIPPWMPVGVADLRAGRGGVTDHYRIGRAFGRTDHTDVGSSFPWDRLVSLVKSHLTPPTPPPSGDDMPLIAYFALPPAEMPGNPPHLVVVDGAVRYRTNHDGSAMPERRLNHEQYEWLLRSAGLDR